MQIDWITVLAQLVNFGVLIWLLQKLLYAPVAKLISQREADIAARIDRANSKASEAELERKGLQAERAALNEARASEIAKAKRTGETLARTLTDQAREKARQAKIAWEYDIKEKSARTREQIVQDAVDHLEAIVGRCLNDLADEPLQDAMARQFIKSLQATSDQDRGEMEQRLKDGAAIVLSAHKISTPGKKRLEAALKEIAKQEIAIDFKTDETMSPGLIFKAGGQSFAWTIDSYLGDFIQHLRSTLELDPDPAPAPEQMIRRL